MTLPSLRDWLFSLKTFIAAMLALYVAFYFELPRPYWAMASVYIVSNPFVGATRSKALYRVLGTALGAVAAVVLVPPFAESPYLLSGLIALWTGVFVYLSISTRAARSYVFLLASYSLSVIALPTVSDPTTVFDIAVSRFEEITLGIVCASVVGSALFPNRLAPTLIERTDAWFRDAILYASEILSGRTAGERVSVSRQRMATSVRGLELLLSQLAYDHVSPRILGRARELHGRMQLMLPVASALADTLAACLSINLPVRAKLEILLLDVERWMNESLRQDPETEAPRLRMRIAELEPTESELARWEGALLANALWRLRQLVDLWVDCRVLRTIIVEETGSWRPRFRHWRIGASQPFLDQGLAVFSAGSTAAVIFVFACVWIASGWQDGAAAVSFGAIGCCFFAAADEPLPMMKLFLMCSSVGVAISGIYLFAILPNVNDFPMLVLFFGVGFIPLGLLMPRPRWQLAATLVALTTATFLGIDSVYDSNFLTFLNSNSAGLAGVVFVSLLTGVVRPFGSSVAAARLTRSNWGDVILSASSQSYTSQRELTARMLDRIVQLIPRVAPTGEDKHPSTESIRDMRIALNSSDLLRLSGKLSGELPIAFNRVLNGIQRHFETCVANNEREPGSADLAQDIDTAIAHLTRTFLAHEAAGGKQRRDALHALVGIKLSLFPGPLAGASPGPGPGPLPGPPGRSEPANPE